MEMVSTEEVLDHFPVGLTVFDSAGYLRFANRQVKYLFEYPEALMQVGVHAYQMLRFQAQRGDFGEGCLTALVAEKFRLLMLEMPDATHYERQLPNGITVEIHRKRLRDGSIAGVYQDISERRHAQDALARERQLLRSTLDLMPCGIVVSDQNLRYLLFNDQVPAMFDFPPGVMREGGSFRDGIGYQARRGDFGEGDPEAITEHRLMLIQQNHEDATFLRQLPSGRTVEIRRRFLNDGRRITIYIDVSESIRVAEELRAARAQLEGTLLALEQTNAQLRQQAHTDALTGAWNRRHFMERVHEELARLGRRSAELGLMILDVDHFKRINDRFGHSEGDRVLVALVKSCSAVLRSADLLCRLGGEEFAILLPDTDLQGSIHLAERLRQQAMQVCLPDGQAVTVSLGVTATKDHSWDTDALLKQVDLGLYRAKQAGRNRVEVVYTDSNN